MGSPWPAIGAELDTFYAKDYFYAFDVGDDNFMTALVPSKTWNHPTLGVIDCEGKFFGTKVLNIFIAQKPYGWVGNNFVWGDSSSDYSQQINATADQIVSDYNRFPYYHTIVYGDLYTVSNSGCPDIIDKMRRTIAKLASFSSSVAGFEYGGTIDSQVPSDFFKERIDKFYGKPLYKTQS